MKVSVLEDTVSHQVRMETTLAEIAEELGIDIQVQVTGKIKEFKKYIENGDVNQLYFWILTLRGGNKRAGSSSIYPSS